MDGCGLYQRTFGREAVAVSSSRSLVNRKSQIYSSFLYGFLGNGHQEFRNILNYFEIAHKNFCACTFWEQRGSHIASFRFSKISGFKKLKKKKRLKMNPAVLEERTRTREQVLWEEGLWLKGRKHFSDRKLLPN